MEAGGAATYTVARSYVTRPTVEVGTYTSLQAAEKAMTENYKVISKRGNIVYQIQSDAHYKAYPDEVVLSMILSENKK